jgi:hypothetical protein
LVLIGVHFYRFDVSFQDVEQALGERGQFFGDRLHVSQDAGPWNSGGDGSIESVDGFPSRGPLPRRWDWDALIEAGGDHLDDVASGEADPLAGVLKRAPIGLHFFRQALELGGPGDDRGEIEAEGLAYRAASGFAGEALSVRAIPADDNACVDEKGEVAAHGRGGHALCAQRESVVGWEYDQIVARQNRLWMESEKGFEDGKRSFG